MNNLLDPIINEVPNRIVLTGGPLAGKSTILTYLNDNYSDKARIMNEVASMLLINGYPQPGKDVEYSDEWLDYINRVILPTQLNMENGHIHAAQMQRKSTVFFDRGLLDPAAYLPGGKKTLKSQYNLDIDSVLERYTMVVHLQSLACVDQDLYMKLMSTNPARYDTPEQAIERDEKLVNAWKDHPNFHFISAQGGIDNVLNQVIELLSPILDVEIERKWLLTHFDKSIFMNKRMDSISQYYVYNGDSAELRVRQIGNQYRLTAKDKYDMSRLEWEVAIPKKIYEMFADDKIPHISKNRYYIPHGKYMLELDMYHTPASFNCAILECEFTTAKEALEFKLPEWIYESMEVTDDPNYKNSKIALMMAKYG